MTTPFDGRWPHPLQETSCHWDRYPRDRVKLVHMFDNGSVGNITIEPALLVLLKEDTSYEWSAFVRLDEIDDPEATPGFQRFRTVHDYKYRSLLIASNAHMLVHPGSASTAPTYIT